MAVQRSHQHLILTPSCLQDSSVLFIGVPSNVRTRPQPQHLQCDLGEPRAACPEENIVVGNNLFGTVVLIALYQLPHPSCILDLARKYHAVCGAEGGVSGDCLLRLDPTIMPPIKQLLVKVLVEFHCNVDPHIPRCARGPHMCISQVPGISLASRVLPPIPSNHDPQYLP
eukprot:CAMPEP_0173187096 /NCGR_PEP_ID=MMETSP1141-20130122/10503_1 /TAXON_ID=483371 /ORGANISM="non described non described, Strain CCMP2298" /LENGTH=169 /DNA_ID=CAMNT_0014110863 /DNA_START=268 /DNA_END=777 /DNA_ORIENTATION=-